MKLEAPSGAWPPRPSSPHATLVVVPGMSQTAAIARNVMRNVRRMGQQPFSCVVFLYEPAQNTSLDNSTSVAQVVFSAVSVVRCRSCGGRAATLSTISSCWTRT